MQRWSRYSSGGGVYTDVAWWGEQANEVAHTGHVVGGLGQLVGAARVGEFFYNDWTQELLYTSIKVSRTQGQWVCWRFFFTRKQRFNFIPPRYVTEKGHFTLLTI